MHVSYTAHKPSSNISSNTIVEYLDKENQLHNNKGEYLTQDGFFGTNFSPINTDEKILTQDIINQLDNNRGAVKYKDSNFFMLNVSPSMDERKHIEKIAVEELARRDIKDTPDNSIFYNLQKEEIIKIQYKLFATDIMKEYAKHFNREIYVDESKLPDKESNKIIKNETEIEYSKFLKEKGIELNTKLPIENRSNEYKTITDLKIIETKEKVLEIQFSNENENKANVFVPKHLLFEQKDGSYKMPLDLYNEKSKEIDNKNIIQPIKHTYIDSKPIKLNNVQTKVLIFEVKDERLKEPFNISFNEKDIKSQNGYYFVSQHLLNERIEKQFDLAVQKEFRKEKENIYKEIAKGKGFNAEKRPLEEKDLLWYGKLEKNRNYKHTDKSVQKNKEIFNEIKEIEKKNPLFKNKKIEELKQTLIKDPVTKEVIKEGNIKGGDQHHLHILVSRHDRTMKYPRNKISISPLSNHRDENMPNGGKSGFNRDSFAQKTQEIYDSKFQYERPKEQTYEFKKTSQIERKIEGEIKGQFQGFINKHTGINTVKQEINPVQNIKQQLGISQIPNSIPKSPLDIAVKGIKKILSQSEGIGY